MPRIALLALLAAAPMMPSTALADEAGSVHIDVAGHAHHREAPAWAPPTGAQVYYGYHFTQVPAYPEPDISHAYPVPVFQGARPLPVVGYASPAHVEWCYRHYNSYRLSDNSFQPHQGVRRACRSPYH